MIGASPAVAAALALLAAGGGKLPQGDPATPTTGTPSAQGRDNTFNPKIGLVTDARAVFADENDDEEEITLAEAEFSFAAEVDPYLSAEAYIAVANEEGETEVEIEEAFGSYRNLGRGLSGRFGKFKGAIGRANRQHTHVLPYLDMPLVIQDLFGEEGFAGTGAEISYLFPTERFLDVTLQAVSNEDGPVFAGTRAANPTAIAHARTFFDFNEDLSAQLGFTAANGPTEENRATVLGVDYTMKWQPGTAGRFWQLETEAYWADGTRGDAEDTFGWYASFTTQLNPRLFATGRLDYSEIPGANESQRGWLVNLTLKPTEFHHWRLEYQHVNSSVEGDRNRLSLQFVWLIGAHPVHRY